MSKFRIHVQEQEGKPIPTVFCNACNSQVSMWWSSETVDSKSMSLECPACHTKGRVLLFKPRPDAPWEVHDQD